MKWYMHENYPYDEIFRGVRSYEEVQIRFLTLPPNQKSGFLIFQKHRQNNLQNILQGDLMAMPPSQEAKSIGSEPSSSTKHKAEKVPKNPEVLFQEIRTSLSGLNDPHVITWFEAFMNLGQIVSHSTLANPTGNLNTIGQQHSTEIFSPITSLTPLQTSFINPNSRLTFVGDITPISPKEIPPSDLFFSKKRKDIMKRESHQKDGVITKMQRLVYAGNDHDGPEFAKEFAGSLGAFSTANQWSMDNLTEQL
jgi:hypothetical protein